MTATSATVSPGPGGGLSPGPRHGVTNAIALALVLSAAYAAGQILFWSSPELTSRTRLVAFFLVPEPTPFRVTRILVPVGWGVAAVLGLALLLIRSGSTPQGNRAAGAWADRAVRACQYGILGCLLLPFTAMPLADMGSGLPNLLLCLPTTLAALLLVHRLQLYRRMPGGLLLAGFGWGALVGGGFGLVMITWFQRSMPGYFISGSWTSPKDGVRELYTLFPLGTAVVTELGKAAGVAVLCLLFRRHIDGLVSGVVLGAAVGLGFNLTETIHYLDHINPAHHPTQFWDRQVVGLMTAHVAFTALAGAGIGAARWLPVRSDRMVAVGGGLLAAVGGHYETDVLLMWLDGRRADWYANEMLGLLIGIPVMVIIASGVFVALYVLILRRGLKAQATGVARALRAEAASGHRAVTEPEIGLLLSPRRRLLLELRVWRRDGTAGLRLLLRFQQAQLDLAVQRWHRERPGADSFIPLEEELRVKVLELKGAPVISSTTPSPSAREATS
ncbi:MULTISPECIES: PrsW family glutamic-type intramembrane protease [Streptomyces]|uniref:PrsW family glutamic-type intramembrane protease n=1 Tax=Streptomyces eurythermus TaxID=42237 RepID=A0ABW6Z7G4_9ACTN|nr:MULTISPECIES: PrsW family glutamic-type intramembrane protease [Streptomyces]QIS68847.1 PrsW family intramembrane metalloprotease [Streptomyces sp. DSM 40868]